MTRSHSTAFAAGSPAGCAAPLHGGNLDAARRLFPDAPQPWIDLSTGINPWPYPVGAIPAGAWTRLPAAGALADLLEAAAGFYGAPDPDHLVAAPGTQALIQLLPWLRRPGRVVVQSPTYAEHARCWTLAGHEVRQVTDLEPWLESADVCILVNPNNPDGRVQGADIVRHWAARMAARGGWLLVDEAFADAEPAWSLAAHVGTPGLMVLRSFGKFFGLAGVRLGFALAEPGLARRIGDALGPWAVAGPALEIGARAFADRHWAARTRQCLADAAAGLDRTLAAGGLHILGGTHLFRLARLDHADAMFHRLAQAGLWVRRFPDQPDRLRFGLPPDRAAAARLEGCLSAAG